MKVFTILIFLIITATSLQAYNEEWNEIPDWYDSGQCKEPVYVGTSYRK